MTVIVSALSQVIGTTHGDHMIPPAPSPDSTISHLQIVEKFSLMDDSPVYSPQSQEDMTAIVSALHQVIGSDDTSNSNYPGVLCVNQPLPNIQPPPVQHEASSSTFHQTQYTRTNFVDDNQLQAGGGERWMMMVVEREHMFDKVVTRSDRRLNRFVIPKQYADRYFPLDSSTKEKALLLNFEDRNGKPWRFRYSKRNNSQRYEMTKGWSRFVKDKKLDVGDIVSFHRGVGSAKDRLFIDCTYVSLTRSVGTQSAAPQIITFGSL